jgi:hypothetical protein
MPEPVTTAAAVAAKAISKAHQSDTELPPDAGEFLARVSGGPLHEIGAWLGDHVRAWRAQRQIGILERARRDLRDAGRNPRQVKWNVLFPLLEAGSLGGVCAVASSPKRRKQRARIVHGHPTLSEALVEAGRAADVWLIHG